MVYINECIDVSTALKKSFKSMKCSHRIQLFPRNFLCWQAPKLYLDIFFQIYDFVCLNGNLKHVCLWFLPFCCATRPLTWAGLSPRVDVIKRFCIVKDAAAKIS